MAQAGVVALGIYLLSLEGADYDPRATLTLFTDADVDFGGVVKPGDRVTVEARKVFWRRRKLRARAEMTLDDGSVVCSGTVSGMGVAQ
jgi:3-hydroxyacyl-[acyl-carrier-protein] dehydratase